VYREIIRGFKLNKLREVIQIHSLEKNCFLSIGSFPSAFYENLLSCSEVRLVSSPVLVALLVEPLSVLEVIVGVVTGERVRRYLLICVSEVDVAHVLLVVEHIGVVGVGVPEHMQVVLALEVTECHASEATSHSQEHVGPHDGSEQEEPRVEGAHQLVIGVRGEPAIAGEVGEGIGESNKGVLHQAEAGEPEHSETGHGGSSPVSVEVLLDGLMEYTITTIDRERVNHNL
jgi:hypothetical protein